ncbi:hypothetical protein AB0L40_06070 [Patulibacter sp. NPDC049589]|uniref:hypothetical protein n=1 Tax=Patulibacter sp. NPDC049589 TaxID=3154731 RepID=UPI0034434FC4
MIHVDPQRAVSGRDELALSMLIDAEDEAASTLDAVTVTTTIQRVRRSITAGCKSTR